VVSLASVAILARLLTPADFGVLAMVLPVALIVDMTINMGLHVAVMHEDRLSGPQVSRLFWIAQRFNVVLLGSMALSAPLLARFYREPRVAMVALIWTLALAFHALGTFPEALLKRQIRFGLLTLIEIGGMVVGVAVAIGAASLGYRSTALVLQVVTWNGVRCLGAFAAARWLPDVPRRSREPDPVIDRLVRYGASFGGSRAVYWLGRQVDRMVVGYASGAAVLGLYDSARRWSWYPFQELYLSITDVVVASLSRARHDAERFREYCRRGFTAFLALPLPAIVFVGVEAEIVVRVLLGERWLGAVPMVRIMCGAAFVDSVVRLTGWIYTAEGNTSQQLRWSVVSTLVTLGAVIGASREGAAGVTWAFASATTVLAIPGIVYCLRTSLLTGRDFVRGVWRPCIAAAAVGATWLLVRTWLPVPNAPVAALVVDALVFAWLYVVAWVMLPGGRRVTREGIQLLRAVTGNPRSMP
jgi:PST family polysaccharide transporter